MERDTSTAKCDCNIVRELAAELQSVPRGSHVRFGDTGNTDHRHQRGLGEDNATQALLDLMSGL